MDGPGGSTPSPPTAEEVGRLWQEAARCLSAEGFEVVLEKGADQRWLLSFGDDPEARSDFGEIYERCVQPAEDAERALALASQPQGGEVVELAKELEECLAEEGIEISVDLVERSSSRTVAAIIDALGYQQDDRTVVKDSRFHHALSCLNRYESLFPDRFGSP